MAALKSPIDITRETALIRNSPVVGANWQATAFSKIQLGFRDLQQQVSRINTQQQTPALHIVGAMTNYTATYQDDVIINESIDPITILFPVQKNRQKAWFIMGVAPPPAGPTFPSITIAASAGLIFGAHTVVVPQLCYVISDGVNLICAGGTA